MCVFFKKIYFPFLLILICLIYMSLPIHAQTASNSIRMDYRNNLLTLEAKNADLKNVLLSLSDEAGVVVKFPDDLKKKITLELSGIPLDHAIKKILKGINNAVIYSLSKKEKTSEISKIYVFQEAEATTLSRNNQRMVNTIKNYEKKLNPLKKSCTRSMKIVEELKAI